MRARFDAPFWGIVVLGLLTLGVFGCLTVGLAAMRAPQQAEILDTNHIALRAEL